ncbi:hypothetical protein MSG28_000606 [Choristoneura fumiferana]|uniref:Uncharacterized protein n=1 Tax=Choristoneura fumiferana TaxID=7141 RepID=A0ACC0K217_CHOFU|nr:hypothetical protein MSG28_000606 [Choristoneura fumiferana]
MCTSYNTMGGSTILCNVITLLCIVLLTCIWADDNILYNTALIKRRDVLPLNMARRFYRDEDELSYRRTRDIQDDLMKARRYENGSQHQVDQGTASPKSLSDSRRWLYTPIFPEYRQGPTVLQSKKSPLRKRSLKKIKARLMSKVAKQTRPQKDIAYCRKIFTIEEKFYRENNKIYAKCSKEMKAQDYQADILKGLVKFKKKDWTFQQDSAPPHKAKLTQKWLMENLPGFISTDEWPSSSSDLNSLDPDTQWREAKIAENKDQLEKIQRELRWLTIQNDDGIGIGI